MEIEKKIVHRMANGTPFVFQNLWVPYGDEAYRLADRLIQRWRKKGYISFVRIGRQSIWSLTDAGKEYVRVNLAELPA